MSATVTALVSDTNTPLVPADFAASVSAAVLNRAPVLVRSEERRVGEECVPRTSPVQSLKWPAEVSTVAAAALPTLFGPIEMWPLVVLRVVLPDVMFTPPVPAVIVPPAVTS